MRVLPTAGGKVVDDTGVSAWQPSTAINARQPYAVTKRIYAWQPYAMAKMQQQPYVVAKRGVRSSHTLLLRLR